MKRSPTPKPNRLISKAVIGLFCLVPFYALISVSVGTSLHIYDVWRLWPEAVLLVLVVAASWLLLGDHDRLQALVRNWIARTVLAYSLLLVIVALCTVIWGNIGAEAVLQGAVIDLRLPITLLAGLVLAPIVWPLRLRWFIVPATAVIVFGLLQAFVLPYDSLTYVGYGNETIPAVTLVDQKAEYARLQSTLRGPNPLGAYVVIALAAGLVWLASARAKYRYQAAVFLAAGLTVLFFSYSRSAYLGFLVTAAATIWLLLARYRRWIIVGVGGLVILFAIGLVTLRQNDQVQNVLFHTDETSSASRSSNEDRASALQSGARDVINHPFGSGVGSAGPASVHSDSGGKIAENYYLQVGQEAGWLGLGLFVLLNGLVIRALSRQKRQPVALVLLASGLGLIVVNMLSHAWSDPTLAYVWWLGAGLVIGSDILPAETLKKHETQTDKRS